MAIQRVTQTMMSRQSMSSLQTGLGRLASLQEQLSTGRVLNRPSDSPADTTSAMRIRSALADVKQYTRNADDGAAWLGTIDAALTSATNQVRRARDLALQGANAGAMGPDARAALAAEVDQLREGLISTANTTHLGRPVFGGVTAGATAYDPTGNWVGSPGTVNRSVADGVVVRVDVDGPSAFGSFGDTAFDHLAQLSTALRAGDHAGVTAAITALNGDGARLTTVLAEAGTRAGRIEAARTGAGDDELKLTGALSEVENADLPRVIVDLKLQETAYQAALAATARVMQPSLLDFLR